MIGQALRTTTFDFDRNPTGPPAEDLLGGEASKVAKQCYSLGFAFLLWHGLALVVVLSDVVGLAFLLLDHIARLDCPGLAFPVLVRSALLLGDLGTNFFAFRLIEAHRVDGGLFPRQGALLAMGARGRCYGRCRGRSGKASIVMTMAVVMIMMVMVMVMTIVGCVIPRLHWEIRLWQSIAQSCDDDKQRKDLWKIVMMV